VLTRDDIVPYTVFLKAFQAAAGDEGPRAVEVRTFTVHGLSDAGRTQVVDSITGFAPSLLVCIGSGAFSFACTHFSTVPRVCSLVVNPALLQSAAGSNAACLRMELSPFAKLSMLKQILPDVQRVGAVYDPQQCEEQVRLLQAAASRLGIVVDARPVSSSARAIHVFENIMTEVDALVMFYDKTVLAPQSLQHMYRLSFRHKVPIVGLSEKYVRLGALFSLDVDIADLGRMAWELSCRCMRDTAACTGVHYPDAQRILYVNATVAPKMSITVPQSVLRQAVMIE